MTREEAIAWLKDHHSIDLNTQDDEAHRMAIKALEQQPILDKIRAEILDEAEYAYADFNLYKEDILNTGPDELPDDDFRFGMKRAVEIIDKYREMESKE